MQTSAQNTTNMSKTVQNNISLIGNQLTDRILAEVKKAKYYSFSLMKSPTGQMGNDWL